MTDDNIARKPGQTKGWVSVRDQLPEDYRPYLCIVRFDDMDGSANFPQVLHYDFKNRYWCENEPATIRTKRLYGRLSVLYWHRIDWPEELADR